MTRTETMTSSPNPDAPTEETESEEEVRVTHRQLAHEVLLAILNRHDITELELLVRDIADNQHDLIDLPQSDVVKTIHYVYDIAEGRKPDNIFDQFFKNA